jgi:hypothetical protein
MEFVSFSEANAALTRGTQLAGPKAMQASDIGSNGLGWCRLRRRRPGHGPDRGNAAGGANNILNSFFSITKKF